MSESVPTFEGSGRFQLLPDKPSDRTGRQRIWQLAASLRGVLRCRLNVVRRRRSVVQGQAHTFSMRWLEARMVSREMGEHDD
jgi:hypothetical protein